MMSLEKRQTEVWALRVNWSRRRLMFRINRLPTRVKKGHHDRREKTWLLSEKRMGPRAAQVEVDNSLIPRLTHAQDDRLIKYFSFEDDAVKTTCQQAQPMANIAGKGVGNIMSG